MKPIILTTAGNNNFFWDSGNNNSKCLDLCHVIIGEILINFQTDSYKVCQHNDIWIETEQMPKSANNAYFVLI